LVQVFPGRHDSSILPGDSFDTPALRNAVRAAAIRPAPPHGQTGMAQWLSQRRASVKRELSEMRAAAGQAETENSPQRTQGTRKTKQEIKHKATKEAKGRRGNLSV